MKIKTYLAMIGVLTCAALVSCNDNDELKTGDGAVRFTAGIDQIATPHNAPGNRAAGTVWGATDEIGIFMVAQGTTVVVADAANRQYTTTGDGNFTPATGNEIYYPLDGSTVGFIAYYPYSPSNSTLGNINVQIPTDQTVANVQPTVDLLYSSGATGNKTVNETTPVALTFEHKLAKIVMNCTADASVGEPLEGMTVTIKGMNTVNTFNLSDGTLGTSPGTPLDITPRMITDGESYDAIILPVSYAADAITVDFKISTGETFTWKLTAADALFEGGNEYTYTVTITRTGVTAEGTITDWITGPDNDRGPVTAE